MEDTKVKLYAAIAFQFVIVFTLVAALFVLPDLREIISGALIGLAVGIGLESIKQ